MRRAVSVSIVSVLFVIFSFGISTPVVAADPASPMGITTRNDNVTALRTSDPWGYMENRVKLMAEAGVAWDRLFVSSGYIVTSTDAWNQDHLTRLDKVLALYKKYGLTPYFLLYNDSTFIGPAGNCIRNAPPTNKTKWEDYLALLVDRYKDSVKYWEISFEENAPDCPFGDEPQTYVNFLKDSSAIIRKHDPQAKILLGRLLPNNIPYLGSLLSRGAASSFDIVSLGGPYQCDLYGESVTRVNAVKNILSQYGISKPIWLTEALCVSDRNLDGVSDTAGYEDQKKYIKEIYKQALGAGVQKIFFQSFVDRNDFNVIGKRVSGIMSIDTAFALHKKPSFAAYQQAARDAGFPPPTPTTNPADLTDEGDTPGDEVNIFDYNALIAGFGTTYDIFDYNILVTNYEK